MKNLSHQFQVNTNTQFVFRRSRAERQSDRAERRTERAKLKESGINRKERREKIQDLLFKQKQALNKLTSDVKKELPENQKNNPKYNTEFDKSLTINTLDNDDYEDPSIAEKEKKEPTLDEKIIKVKEDLKDLPENSNERFALEGKQMNLEWMKKMESSSPEEREKLLSGTMKIAAYVITSPEEGADLGKRKIIITELLERINYAMNLSNIKQTSPAIADITTQLQQKNNLIEAQYTT